MMVQSHSVTLQICWLVVFQIVLIVQDDMNAYAIGCGVLWGTCNNRTMVPHKGNSIDWPHYATIEKTIKYPISAICPVCVGPYVTISVVYQFDNRVCGNCWPFVYRYQKWPIGQIGKMCLKRQGNSVTRMRGLNQVNIMTASCKGKKYLLWKILFIIMKLYRINQSKLHEYYSNQNKKILYLTRSLFQRKHGSGPLATGPSSQVLPHPQPTVQ